MVKPTDTLEEACKVAGIVAGEEVEVEMLERQIADMFRATCRKIFSGSTKYRMPTHKVGVYILDDDITPTGVTVWQNIGVVLDDRVNWNGNFYGNARTLRVTTDGRILSVWQHVPQCQAYDLFSGSDYTYPSELDRSEAIRPATDHEIAANAVELASDLLTALRSRIDSAKEEKAELRRIVGLDRKESRRE